VNAKSSRVDLAVEFIEYATSGEGARIYAKSARGNPARISILSDPELQAERPEFPLMMESLKIAKAEPSVVYYSAMHEVMNEKLTKILIGLEEPEVAFIDAESRIRQLME
jgi:maltose-binding protein MalE